MKKQEIVENEILNELMVLQYKDNDALKLILDYVAQHQYAVKVSRGICLDLKEFFGFSLAGKRALMLDNHRFIIEYMNDAEYPDIHSSVLDYDFSGPPEAWRYADDFKIIDSERYSTGYGFHAHRPQACYPYSRYRYEKLIAGEVAWFRTPDGHYEKQWYTTLVPRFHLVNYSASWGLALREEEGEVLLQHGIRSDIIHIAERLNVTVEKVLKLQRRISNTFIEDLTEEIHREQIRALETFYEGNE